MEGMNQLEFLLFEWDFKVQIAILRLLNADHQKRIFEGSFFQSQVVVVSFVNHNYHLLVKT